MKNILTVIIGIVIAVVAIRIILKLLWTVIGGVFSVLFSLAVLALIGYGVYKLWGFFENSARDSH